MPYYGATVGAAYYIHADNDDEAASKILEAARADGLDDPWIIDLSEEEEDTEGEDYGDDD